MSDETPSLITRDRAMLVCCALAALIIPVWLLADSSPASEASVATSVTPFGQATIEPPADALASPLFNPDRTAPEALDEGANMTAEPEAPAAPPAPLPSLVGLIVGRGTPGLALVRGGDGQTHLLHAGEVIDGWQIGAITASGATFDINGRQERVGLNFGKAASATPPAEGSAAPQPSITAHPDQAPAGPNQ